MNLPALTVGRPVLTAMTTLIVVAVGLMALFRLPIDLLPDVTYPTLTVTTGYGNAGPEEVEQLITRPIEGAVAAVPGVERLSSTSSEGNSNVRISFAWGTNLDEATNEVRDRLDRIIGRLPDAADRPLVRKFDTASLPILLIGVAGEINPIDLRQLIDDRIGPRLERIPGVAAIDVWGGLQRETRVEIDPTRLRALGLELDQLRQAIVQANVNLPAGDIREGRFDVRVRTQGEFSSIEELENTVVAWRDGQPIALHQIAAVRDTHQRITRIIRIDDQPGVRLAVRKQSDANTVEVAAAVRAELLRLQRDYPNLQLVTAVDNSQFIQRSISNVTRSLIYGGSLAVLVLLFFIRHLRTTLVAATAIPVSVIAAFGLIYFGGFTLNLMTLGGLALGVGLMVDNTIVVIENITRHAEELGEDARHSAVLGTTEVTPAIIASTLTTVAIFLPMLFTQELAGVLFRQLAYVVAFALLCSLLLAITLVPMLMARARRRPEDHAVRRAPTPLRLLGALCGGIMDRIQRAYLRALRAAIANRTLSIGFAVVSLIAVVGLVPQLGTEFMPASDEGEIRINLTMEPGIPIEVVDARMRALERRVWDEVPELQHSVVTVGASSFWGGNPARGDIRMTLVPLGERSRSSEEIAAALRRSVTNVGGATVRVRAQQGMVMRRVSAAGGNDESLSVEIYGFDLDVLDALSDAVTERLRGIDGVTAVESAREAGLPQQLLRIDRARAADLGVSVETIARTMETALSGRQAGVFRDQGSEHRIWLQLQEDQQFSVDELLDIAVRGAEGQLVALRSLVRVERGEGPVQIFRQEQQRMTSVSASVSGRDLGSIVADVRAALAELPLPRNVDIQLAGDYEEQSRTFSELGLALLLAVALVYMVLASLYESFIDPLIVMSAVPLAIIGVVLMLLLTNTTLNTQSLIGCIMLVGIAVNNAILLLDQSAKLHRGEGRPAVDAVVEAGRRRLRPILMTSLTTMLALTPLALGLGEGGESQAPMARAVIGGLLSATVITLFLIPILYLIAHPERRARAQAVPPRTPAAAVSCALLAIAALLLTAPARDAEALDLRLPPDWGVESAPAEAGTTIGIEEAVLIALQNNRALAVERLQPAIRGTFEVIEQARFDPRLFAEFSVDGSRDVRETTDARDQPSVFDSDRRLAEAGLRTLLPTGTEISLSLRGLDRETTETSQADTRFGLSLTQALLQGGRLDANLVGLRQAEFDSEASRYELRGFTEALVADVEQAYWAAVLAERRVDIFEEGWRVAERQLDETRRRIRAGQSAETDEAAPRAELARRQQGLIDARAEQAIRRLELLRLMNPPASTLRAGGIRLSSPAAISGDEAPVLDPAERYTGLAKALRPEVNEARLRYLRGDLELIRTRNGELPRLDVFISLGKTGYADSIGSALRDLDAQGYDYAAGLRFELPIGRREPRALSQRALLERDRALGALGNLEQLVEFEVRRAWIDAFRSREQLTASAETRTLQEEVLRAEQARFRAGTATPLSVALAQRDVIEAQLDEEQAQVRYRQALINLHRLSGSLLLRRAIDLPGDAAVRLD
jgi:hydrophobic/amphiphilic exporter-1 (mainly G- bacteria), HAE1 family